MPALESLRARVGMRIHHAEQVHAAFVDPAVEVVLRARERLLGDQAKRAAGCGQALVDDALERPEHAPHRPALERAEAHHALEFVAAADPARKDGERAACRLHVARKAQIPCRGGCRQRVEGAEGHVRLRAHALQHPPGMQLVLAGQDGLGRRAGQAAALGHHRRAQRALEFMMREHRRPAVAPRGTGLQVGKAIEVEGGHARLAQQAAGLQAAPVELQAGALEPRMRQGVIVLVEQQADAARGSGGGQALSVGSESGGERQP